MTDLTSAQRRALAAVAAGEVLRIYRQDGNVFRVPEGVGASVLWRLEAGGLISDGPGRGGGICEVQLTKKGKAALDGESGELHSALDFLLDRSDV